MSDWVVSRRISWAPASPAPKTMIFTAPESGRRDRSLAAKATYRAPSMATRARDAPAKTVGGRTR